MTPAPTNAIQADAERNIWGVIAASSAGTVIEWYDFFIFGTLSAVISGVFYP
ncbi:MAG: MFS transporter, partial [Gemmatimonadaceae bacterium]